MSGRTLWLVLIGTLWAAPAAGAQNAEEDVDARLLAGSCYGCHAPTSGAQSAMADLSRLSVEAISARLKDYQQRNGEVTIMNRIARGYSAHEIDQLAEHFGRASP